ncbi:MAG: methyltransferase [Hydrogenophaga sp.]|nr:methyltransferase [Hydrogenophaga sp.]
MDQDIVSRRYLSGEYADKNPDWDSGDASWKAALVKEIMTRNNVHPESLVEVGCGSGGVLAELRSAYPGISFSGYDIAPGAASFWPRHAAADIQFEVGDFLELNEKVFDVVLMLDVLEHLGDPFSFLERLRAHSRFMVFHIPLDLSALSVLRESPLLHVREQVGHLHYFTRNLALTMLKECGYEIVEARYTGASFSAPRRSLKTKLAGLFRRAVFSLSHDFGARLMGGETLLVLATPRVQA